MSNDGGLNVAVNSDTKNYRCPFVHILSGVESMFSWNPEVRLSVGTLVDAM